MHLSLLVLKVRDIAQSRSFYERLGFSFLEHLHGKGSPHICSTDLGFPLELYPATQSAQNYVALGFTIPSIQTYRYQLMEHGIACSEITDTEFGQLFVVRDPDNNRIEIYAEES